jgi:hypothetical protein
VVGGPSGIFQRLNGASFVIDENHVHLFWKHVFTMAFVHYWYGVISASGKSAWKDSSIPCLRLGQRENTLCPLHEGQTRTNVASVLNVSPSTTNHLWTRFQRTGSLDDSPRIGRLRVNMQAQDRFILVRNICNRFLSASSIVQINPDALRISDRPEQTVYCLVEGLKTTTWQRTDRTPSPG